MSKEADGLNLHEPNAFSLIPWCFEPQITPQVRICLGPLHHSVMHTSWCAEAFYLLTHCVVVKINILMRISAAFIKINVMNW